MIACLYLHLNLDNTLGMLLFFPTGCGCNEEGTVNDTSNCDQETGTCMCKDGWFGDQCFFGKCPKFSTFDSKPRGNCKPMPRFPCFELQKLDLTHL